MRSWTQAPTLCKLQVRLDVDRSRDLSWFRQSQGAHHQTAMLSGVDPCRILAGGPGREHFEKCTHLPVFETHLFVINRPPVMWVHLAQMSGFALVSRSFGTRKQVRAIALVNAATQKIRGRSIKFCLLVWYGRYVHCRKKSFLRQQHEVYCVL